MKAILRSINNFSCKLKQSNNLKYNISPKIRSNKFKSISGNGNITIEDAIKKDLKDYEVYGNTVQKILPDGYTQVDYIESSGTQYIDTNYTPAQNDNLELKNVSTPNISGTLFSAGTGDYQFILHNNRYFKYFASGAAADIGNDLIFNNANIKIEEGSLYVDNVLKGVSTYGGEVNTTLQLFRRANGGYYKTCSIGEVIITNKNTLVRDFIPCYRNSDNEVGLYDLVNDVFYTNQGTGVFTYGNVAPTPDAPIEMVSVGDNKTGLPFGYTQVDYIESSGTQYIDTGIKGNQDTKVNLDFEATNFSYPGNKSIIGSRTGATEKHYGITISGGANPYLYSGYNNVSQQGVQISLNTKYNVFKDKNIMYLDNTEITNATYTTFETPTNMFIFAMNEGGAKFYSSIKLFKLKIYNDNVLERNFIPCYRNSDNEVGLYDLVNNVFYTNQGTGVFTYGSEIEKGGYKIPVNVRSENLFSSEYAVETQYKKNGDINTNRLYVLESNKIVMSYNNNNHGALYFNKFKLLPGTYYLKAKLSQSEEHTSNYFRYAVRNFTNNVAIIPSTADVITSNFSLSFTISEELDISFMLIPNTAATGDLYIENVMLSRTDEPYQPYYKETTNIYLDEPLRGIGEYSDYIDFVNSKVVRHLGEVILDGSETWNKNQTWSDYGPNTNAYTSYKSTMPNAVSNAEAISSHFIRDLKAYSKDENGLFEFSTYPIFRISKDIAPTVTDFKNWLSQNNVTVDYVLDTPTEEDMELSNINLIEGKNIITIGTEVQGVFEVEYYSKEIIDISDYKYNLRKVED